MNAPQHPPIERADAITDVRVGGQVRPVLQGELWLD